MKPKVVFLHGWGMNSAIWTQVYDLLRDQVEIHLLDLPGYGRASDEQPTRHLQQTAKKILDAAPDNAIWVGWSLGGMVAMQAALIDATNSRKIRAIQILCSTPKFVCSEGWNKAMQPDVFEGFADSVMTDEEQALRNFLLLQSGDMSSAKTIAKEVLKAISVYPLASKNTLAKGIKYLRETDLRNQISNIVIPVQVVADKYDRLIPYKAGEYIASQINNSDLHVTSAGHMPFFTEPQKYVNKLIDFVKEVA